MAVARRNWLQNLRVNPNLMLGLFLITFIILVSVLGPMLINQKKARVGAVWPAPSVSAIPMTGGATGAKSRTGGWV